MSRAFKLLVPALAAVLALGVGTATATKVVSGRSLKNGTVTERKLSPSVRNKLNAAGPQGVPGPQGPQGLQGPPGTASPSVVSAVANITGISPLALGSTATILTLSSPPGAGSGPIAVNGPTRLLITAQVNAFKTTSDASKFARIHCQLSQEGIAGPGLIGRQVEASMAPVSVGAVLTSLSLVGSLDVDSGQHNVGIRCEASTAGSNTGVSFQSASINVVAVPR